MDGYSFLAELASNIGQTVTIFTTSGGESGRGFTGVLTIVNPSFIRLVTQIGPGPSCALGSCCDDRCEDKCEKKGEEGTQLGGQGRANCRVDDLGSIVDIPVDRIAAFVHNAVGSN
jgi:hypothetical protein